MKFLMPIYTLRCEMLTERSLESTFEVFENPYNLAKITPSSMNFRVTSKERVEMRKGAEIEYIIKWLGIPIHWKTIIEDYQPPLLFIDRQEKGPYSLWRHRHTFEQTPQGTKVADHVDYQLPLGPLGAIAHAVMVKRQLLEIFNFRQQELGKMFGGNTKTTVKPYVTVGGQV